MSEELLAEIIEFVFFRYAAANIPSRVQIINTIHDFIREKLQ